MSALTIVSWNCLANAYVTPERYPDSPVELLDPAVRRRLVLDVVGRLSAVADLVCLQEAEADLADDLAERHGADRVWWASKQRSRPDGCVALLGATSSWEVVGHRAHPFEDATPPSGHIAQLLDLAYQGLAITVANTHLRWAPDDEVPHIGVVQVAELAQLVRGDARPWVVCGDLNVDGMARHRHPGRQPVVGRHRGRHAVVASGAARGAGPRCPAGAGRSPGLADGMKFADCLPTDLALAVATARLVDRAGVAVLLAEVRG